MRQGDLYKLSLFPITTKVDSQGHLLIGGCDCVDLCKKFGTPLYVFDENAIRSRCREFKTEFTTRYPDTIIAYASKAFLNRTLAGIIKEEGLGLDVVSGGELSVAQSANFPSENVYFHGNNKTADELKLALDWGIGRIVVDNLHELELLDSLARDKGVRQDILLRVTPGVDPHTHRHTTTGILDSKFGFPLADGQAEAAVSKAKTSPNLNLVGLHFHLGSPIAETSPYATAINLVLNFAREMKDRHDFSLDEFSTGGGFAIRYTLDQQIPGIADYAEAITTAVSGLVEKLGLPSPKLIIEPGRAVVAQAGVALYTVGSVKEIPGVRKYVCVDGGMGDNIRPALYEAGYEALAANKAGDKESTKVTIAGKYCESGDILARDVNLAPVSAGDIIAIPVSGAYSIPMSSNYNMVPRPAIVMVNDGNARVIRKRETYDDLMRLDVVQ
jgi:diaminopimelate decarboxylase